MYLIIKIMKKWLKRIFCVFTKEKKNRIANICEINVTALQTHTIIHITYNRIKLYKSPEVFYKLSRLFGTAKYKPLVNV